MMKRLSALCLVFVMVLGLCACGKSKTPEEIMQETAKNMEAMKSYSMSLGMEMAMSANGMTLPMKVTSSSEVTVKPMVMHTKMDMSMGMLGSMKMEMYVEESGDKSNTYMQMVTADGQKSPWQKQEGPATQNMVMDSTKAMKMLTNLKVAEDKEEVNGVKALRIDGELTGKNMLDMFKSMSSSMGGAQGMEMLNPENEEILKTMEGASMKVTYFINEDDMTLVSAKLDMTEMMKKIPTGTEGLSFDKMEMTMGFSDFNKFDKIEIPAEALNGELIPNAQ